MIKNPTLQGPKLSSGLRGTRYFIEFPIEGENVDAFSILISVQSFLNKHKKEIKVRNSDSFKQDNMISYLIDYDTPSSSIEGTKSQGSLYI